MHASEMSHPPDDPVIPRALRPFLLGVRPPTIEDGRLGQLRFLRDLQLRALLIAVPLTIVVVLVADAPWAPIALGALLLLSVLDLVYLVAAIARESSRNGDGGT